MKIIIGIDDARRTDGGGAGETATTLAETIQARGWGSVQLASRHRLYPNPKAGYKKHNTARSFTADIETSSLPDFITYACKEIQRTGVSADNAGLAIVIPEQLENSDDLIDYAYRVKENLVSKDEALILAEKPGIEVYELSGNGKGIIGALAGAGLRLTGNDGQFRGKLRVGTGEGYVATVEEIIANTHVQQVKNMDFENLSSNEQVRMGEKVKVVLLDDKYTLMVFPTGKEVPPWQTSTTNMLRIF